ncbi:hypothetical protein CYMTET_50664 [Cymbomonas tetramitiformis]|uniref:Uncharacterized protein n=1 Tax=Cymbomonas tetramitiformis TaxID=36881 RepID=A0AAE0BPM3_9CHLO|nr:hypothetical protein CYMTET_50664 [Cymbomonas tetramitiformis]
MGGWLRLNAVSPSPGSSSRRASRESRPSSGRGSSRLLHAAAENGSISELRRLLAAGEPVDRVSSGGVTALLRAVHAGQLEAVSVLLEAGANIHATDKFGQAPIHISVLKGHDHILRVLLDSHANVETATQDGNTGALYSNEQEMGDMGQDGNTAHSIAISKNLSSVVGLLDTFVQGHAGYKEELAAAPACQAVQRKQLKIAWDVMGVDSGADDLV